MPNEWKSMTKRPPKPGHKIVALYSDGSGSKILYVVSPTEIIDEDGATIIGNVFGSFSHWTYAPDGFRLLCENDKTDPVHFPIEPIFG